MRGIGAEVVFEAGPGVDTVAIGAPATAEFMGHVGDVAIGGGAHEQFGGVAVGVGRRHFAVELTQGVVPVAHKRKPRSLPGL